MGGRVAKVRLVLLGYQDPELASLATASPTLARSTRSILFALGAHRQWPVRTLDARAAFLAGDPHHARQRPLYMRLPAEWLQELQLQPGTLFKLLKAAYGLCESTDAWNKLAEGELEPDRLHHLWVCCVADYVSVTLVPDRLCHAWYVYVADFVSVIHLDTPMGSRPGEA